MRKMITPATPEYVVQHCYIDEQNTVRFRANEGNDRALWGKPVPRVLASPVNSSVSVSYQEEHYFLGNRIFQCARAPGDTSPTSQMDSPVAEQGVFLEVVRNHKPHIKYDTPYDLVHLIPPGQSYAEALPPRTHSLYVRLLTEVHRKDYKLSHAYARMRAKCITTLYEKRINKLTEVGINVTSFERRAVRQDIAMRIGLSERTVQNILTNTGVEVEDTQTTDRKTPEYRAIARAVQRARVRAANNKPPIPCSFSVDSLFTDNNAPLRCPVLGLTLDYTADKLPLSPYVWRGDTTHDLVDGKATVMSTLAARLIEGKKISLKTADALMTNYRCHTEWLEWTRTHTVGLKREH